MVTVAKKKNKAAKGDKKNQRRNRCSFKIRNSVMEKILEQNWRE